MMIAATPEQEYAADTIACELVQMVRDEGYDCDFKSTYENTLDEIVRLNITDDFPGAIIERYYDHKGA
jgi:hypothetical protein